jgi:thioredoxin
MTKRIFAVMPARPATCTGMSQLILIEGEAFASEVLAADVPVLVEFVAPWCGPCRVQKPILAELAREGAGRYKICTVDVDANPGLAVRYGVRSAPTLIVFFRGEPVANRVGLTPKPALRELLAVDARAASAHAGA